MNLKKQAIKILAVIIILCAAGTVFAYSGLNPFDRASRFYGAWELTELVGPTSDAEIFEDLEDGFYMIFHTNKSLEIRLTYGGQSESAFGRYNVISSTQLIINEGSSEATTLTYEFNTNNLLYLYLPEGGYYALVRMPI